MRRGLSRPLLGAALALPLALGAICSPRPQILAPTDQSPIAIADDPNVVIDFGAALPPGAIVRIHLVTGIDPEQEGVAPQPTLTDISARFGDLSGASQASAQLGAADLHVGRSTLYVNVDRDANGVAEAVVSSTFSFEPDLDVALAARCDLLDPASCMLPFPNDHFTVADPTTDSGRRIAFVQESMPRNGLRRRIDPTPYNRNDGFSPGPKILTVVPGVDLARTHAAPITDIVRSLDTNAPVAIIDAETGERQLFWAELNDPVHDVGGVEPGLLILRPGKNLRDGRRHIVALRRMKDAADEIIEPSRAFRVYRDAIPTFLPEIEARRPAMEEIFARLAAAGIARNDLFLAWDFTVASTRSIAGPLLAMRDDAFTKLGADTPAFAITSIEDRAASDTNLWRRVIGTFEVPNYLTGTGDAGSLLLRGADGLPVQSTTNPVYTADFRCVIPRSATATGGDPVVPARPSLYGHGLLGDEGEVFAGHVAAMANGHNFVFCAAKWIGLSEDEVDEGTVYQIIDNLSNFPAIPERLHQGMLNALFLGRLLIHPEGLVSHPAFQAGAAGTAVIDRTELFYDGNSQGAIAGGALTAIAQDFTRAVLGVPGMNYSTLLRRSVDFDQFLLFVNATYAQPVERTLALALIQMLWDPADTNGHANHITGDTYPGTPPHQILLHVAWGDFQVANVSAEVEARTIGAHIYQPALSGGVNLDRGHWEEHPFFGIPPIVFDASGRFDGSALVYWDSGNATPPNGNVPPRPGTPAELTPCTLAHDEDPHECPRRQPAARLQKSVFLASDGAVIDVCGGQPCQAPSP